MNLQTCLSKHPHPALDLEKWQKTADLMAELYQSTCGAIVQFRDDEFNVIATNKSDDNFLHRDSTWPIELKTFCRQIIETKERLYAPAPMKDLSWCESPAVSEGPVRSYYGIPVFWPDKTVFCTICVIDTKETNYPSILLRLLQQLALLIEADLKHIIDYEEIKNLALTDELTGVYNRRGLSVLSGQLLKSAKLHQHNIGIIYVDIDDFKSINDQYGHTNGDEIIKALGLILQRFCRNTDVVSRVGGDEFAVLLQKVSESDLDVICQRIERSFKKVIDATDKEHKTSASISYGYKIYSTNTRLSIDDMICRADTAMYKHKKSKKDRHVRALKS
jgi:diguanylate cyclase (GGDEF)-like protein